MRHNGENKRFLSILFGAMLLAVGFCTFIDGNALAAQTLNTGKEDACGDGGPTNQSSGGGVPSGGSIRDYMGKIDEAAVKAAGEAAAGAIKTPKHVKEIVTCLKDLMNVGLTVGVTFGWPSLQAIFTSLINQACAMLQSYMDQLLNELVANITLPDIMTDVMGIAMPGFSGNLTAQFVRGVPAGTVNIGVNTPAGQCNSNYDPDTSILKTVCVDPQTGKVTTTEYDTVTGQTKTY